LPISPLSSENSRTSQQSVLPISPLSQESPTSQQLAPLSSEITPNNQQTAIYSEEPSASSVDSLLPLSENQYELQEINPTEEPHDIQKEDDENSEEEKLSLSHELEKAFPEENLEEIIPNEENIEEIIPNEENIDEIIPNEENIDEENLEEIIPNEEENRVDIFLQKEDEDEEDEDEENIQDYSNKNWDGKKLTHPNPFQEKIEENEPIFFVKNIENGMKAYSRTCPSNQKRQPVLVTPKEMDRILINHPTFLEDGLKDKTILRYGTSKDPRKHNYYICPRYWCLKNWSPWSLGDKGCGDIIPENAKEVPKGSYVYSFQDNKRSFPGFLDLDNDGVCKPCCFGKIAKKRLELESICLNKMKKIDEPSNIEKIIKEKELPKYNKDDIKSPFYFPLIENQYGHLPINIRNFIQHNEAGCDPLYTTNLNKITKNKECLLRVGVESNLTQSFLSCIAKAYYYSSTEKKQMTIREFKEHIISKLTIDKFIKYQNGELVNLFHKKDNNYELLNLEPFEKSILFTKINTEKEQQFFENVVYSYHNFINFLKDDEVVIDYTYLWDLICDEEEGSLFQNGINLVILRSTCDDPTCNVEIICPTNPYSKNMFNSNKSTLIIYTETKHNYNYYEPIYIFKNKNISEKSKNTEGIIIKPFFNSGRNKTMSPSIKRFFNKIVEPIMKQKCHPFKTFQYISPLSSHEMIKLLKKNYYKIHYQVVNYMNKVIMLYVEKEDVKCVIPCYPSSIHPDYEYKFIDVNDHGFYRPYNKTKNFLRKVKRETGIPCNPIFKIIEGAYIIGILTETNQFIMISKPELENKYEIDTLKPIKTTNYLAADMDIMTDETVDEERKEEIKILKLETLFFNTFRNTIRLLLNKYENLKFREYIEELTKNMYIPYKDKYKIILELLQKIGKDFIIFEDINISQLFSAIKNISSKNLLTEQDCDKDFCMYSKDHKLILPLNGLLSTYSSTNNKILFYGKMTDQLIRYNRINSYFFKPNSYLSFGSIEYELGENEILITDSELKEMMDHDYKISYQNNKYVHYNTFDNANKITRDEIITMKDIEYQQEDECKKTEGEITISYWKKCLPNYLKAIKYVYTISCGYEMIRNIYSNFRLGEELSIENIKTILLEFYSTFTDTNKILDILDLEGKKTLVQQFKSGNINWSEFIFSEGYFITNLDLWIIITKFKIPSFIISQKTLLETNHNENIITLYGEPHDSFIFIVTSAIRSVYRNHYQILYKEDTNNIRFEIDIIKNREYHEIFLKSIQEKMTLLEFLDSYTIKTKTKYIKKSKKKIFLQDEPIIHELDIPRTNKGTQRNR